MLLIFSPSFKNCPIQQSKLVNLFILLRSTILLSPLFHYAQFMSFINLLKSTRGCYLFVRVGASDATADGAVCACSPCSLLTLTETEGALSWGVVSWHRQTRTVRTTWGGSRLDFEVVFDKSRAYVFHIFVCIDKITIEWTRYLVYWPPFVSSQWSVGQFVHFPVGKLIFLGNPPEESVYISSV